MLLRLDCLLSTTSQCKRHCGGGSVTEGDACSMFGFCVPDDGASRRGIGTGGPRKLAPLPTVDQSPKAIEGSLPLLKVAIFEGSLPLLKVAIF